LALITHAKPSTFQKGRGKEKELKFYTIGYGGRKPEDFIALLKLKGIKTIVDVRFRPDHAYKGYYAKAKSRDKGIQKLLADNTIEYISLIKLGNPFMENEDWRERYQQLLEKDGDLLIEPLYSILGPLCLMCAEKSHTECHRQLIADFLIKKGFEVEHIE